MEFGLVGRQSSSHISFRDMQVIMSVLAPDTKWDTVEGHIQELSERWAKLDMPTPAIWYVDNFMQLKNKIKKVFPGVHVRQDPIHFMWRFMDTIPKSEPRRGEFQRALRDAIFMVDARDQANLAARLKRKPTQKEVHRECRRWIPNPRVLRSRLAQFRQAWIQVNTAWHSVMSLMNL